MIVQKRKAVSVQINTFHDEHGRITGIELVNDGLLDVMLGLWLPHPKRKIVDQFFMSSGDTHYLDCKPMPSEITIKNWVLSVESDPDNQKTKHRHNAAYQPAASLKIS